MKTAVSSRAAPQSFLSGERRAPSEGSGKGASCLSQFQGSMWGMIVLHILSYSRVIHGRRINGRKCPGLLRRSTCGCQATETPSCIGQRLRCPSA